MTQNISDKSPSGFFSVPTLYKDRYTHVKTCVNICRVSSYIHAKFNLFLFICYKIMIKIKFKTMNIDVVNVAIDHQVTS